MDLADDERQLLAALNEREYRSEPMRSVIEGKTRRKVPGHR